MGLIIALSRSTLAILAHLEPDLIIPGALKRFYPSMQGLLEAHRTTTSLASLILLMPTIARHRLYRNHITTLLGLALPGIDTNDLTKTNLTLTFMISTCMLIPLWNLSDPGDETALASKWIQEQMEVLEKMPGDDIPPSDPSDPEAPRTDFTEDELDAIARSSTGGLEEWLVSFFNQIFGFLSNMPDPHKVAKTAEESLIPLITLAVSTVLQSLEPKLFTLALHKMQTFITGNVYHNAGDATANICRAFVEIRPEESLDAFLQPIVTNIREEIMENGAGKSGRITTTEVLPRDRTLLWNLKIFFALLGPRTGSTLYQYINAPNSMIKDTIRLMAMECKGTTFHYIGKSLVNSISSLTGIYTLARPLVRKERLVFAGSRLIVEASLADWAPLTDPEKLDVKWHIPTEDEIAYALEILQEFATIMVQRIRKLVSGNSVTNGSTWTDDLREPLKYLMAVMLAAIPLYQRCSPCEEWEIKSEDVPDIDPPETLVDEDEAMEIDPADVEEDDTGDDEDEGESDDTDAPSGRGQKYADGFINNPLSHENFKKLYTIHMEIGDTLSFVAKHLRDHRKDDVQATIEIITSTFCWLHPHGLAHMNDIRMEMTTAAISTVKRSTFQVKGLGKTYYPEAFLVQRVESMHRERVSNNLILKPTRPWWQNGMISQIVALTINSYLDIRRAAQASLYGIIRRTKKWAPMVILPLFNALKDVDNLDTIKGALHMLHINTIEHTIARNWNYLSEYIERIIYVCQKIDRVCHFRVLLICSLPFKILLLAM